MGSKTNPGNFFEDFELGQDIVHATPRTITEGDVSLYTSLYGMRHAANSSDMFAMNIGYDAAPIDDFLAFHVVFGKTVADISLNAVANLGYANGVFGAPLYPGDTVSARSEVIGLKENSSGKTGVVHVRSVGRNQNDEMVLDYVRWVMVRKRDENAPAPEPRAPELAASVPVDQLVVPPALNMSRYDFRLAGSPCRWGDYEIGERIDHVDGMTIEEAEHMMATRLYQNTARVHFNQHEAAGNRFGRRLMYGGHVISLARALSFNGLANAFKVAAINGGRHVSPTFAGDTVYAWSEVLEKSEIPDRDDLGALRLRLVACKNRPCPDHPYQDQDGKYAEAVVLDFDHTVLVPR